MSFKICFLSKISNIPFLNGGLFEEYDVDNLNLKLPDDLLFKIVDNFLEEYNFTITEESPFDLDIAIDPAMLGKIYESLIAEEERGKEGIFYTPRIEVDLMCRLGILEYILEDKNQILGKNNQKEIINNSSKKISEVNTLTNTITDEIKQLATNTTIPFEQDLIKEIESLNSLLENLKENNANLNEKLEKLKTTVESLKKF